MRRFMKRGITHLLPFNLESASGGIIERMHIRHFFYYTREYALETEKIYSAYERFLYLVNSVPPVILHQFTLLSILDEVKAINDIEGVHSTRKEIQDILDGNVSKSERLESIVHKYKSLMDHAEIPFSISWIC